MSFKSYPVEGFLVKVKEHGFAARRGIVLPIFHTNVSKFPRELRLDLQINVCTNENLNCGFFRDDISLN